MPTLHLAYAPTHHEPDLPALATTLTELTGRLLHKRAELTALRFERVAPEAWTVGARTLAEQRLASYRFSIDVTAGTNTEVEIAGFIEAVHGAMQSALGTLHPASYVLVQQQPAPHWGWGGRTQAARAAPAQADNPGP